MITSSYKFILWIYRMYFLDLSDVFSEIDVNKFIGI